MSQIVSSSIMVDYPLHLRKHTSTAIDNFRRSNEDSQESSTSIRATFLFSSGQHAYSLQAQVALSLAFTNPTFPCP